ncbi:hypothetical protein M1C59_00245 [Gordonia terrae]|uniref:Eco57I restriction-modification methylase domain-containing protein n=1 Tax=Gordonia terrae TaxID=2055 RepID=UPI00200A5991|nr:hypothetical protein [Gordonia terrae]UPW09354.1 hypothetical protein M1C59_00245 [Gordonia terrae]
MFTARKGKTQVQLTIAVIHSGTAYLFGPDPQAQAVELPVEQAQRQLQSVLDEPDVLAATERYAVFRKANDTTGAVGFTNSGLFATHHITSNVPRRPDWQALGRKAEPLLSKRGKQLVEALGFGTSPGPNGTKLLSIGGHPPRAVAVLLDDSEQFDTKTQRFQLSPVAFGLAVASRHEVPWLVVLRKDQIRLYPGRDGVGVGSKGQADTFFEIDLSTLDSKFAALLPLAFSAEALVDDGTADELLRDSARFATELGERLRERIYEEIVPPLAVEVAQRLSRSSNLKLDAEGLNLAYRVALHLLFRLIFQAYAEDRGLLPSGRNEAFDANSLKTNARRLIEADAEQFGESSTIWFDLVQVWNAIDKGNPQWQIPSYNGGLFSSDPERSREGALLSGLSLPDTVLGPVLRSLLIDVNEDGVLGPVDFRSLSVREFGTIYEGLLESSLSVAVQDLAHDNKGRWVAASNADSIVVAEGDIYFHTASGERKATGSYFTPKVVVDHLIEQAIVPGLSTHLKGIDDHLSRGDASAAARDFFDFRVADLAMGSGHFLVAAVDKIEALMRTFLAEHTVPGVTDELLRLAEIASEALGTDDVAKSEVDQVGLLRRQIARRCIYGFDVNPMAVELCRLALWIHTFVPGLPMSNLDHGLVQANSLTGMVSVNEALEALQPGRSPDEYGLFDSVLTDSLVEARKLLTDVASASEANKSEVEEGARLLAEAAAAARPAREIFDIAVAARLGRVAVGVISSEQELQALGQRSGVVEISNTLQPAHMPFLFPEVFLRLRPGFDVLVGNPPWDKVRHEPQQFWVVRDPGLNALPAAKRDAHIEHLRDTRPNDAAEEKAEQRQRELLQDAARNSYSLLGTGHFDFAKMFAERYLDVMREGGSLGVVLPQGALLLGGWAKLRKALLKRGTVAAVEARNAGGWLFEDVHRSYTIVFLSLGLVQSDGTQEVAIYPGVTSLDLFRRGIENGPMRIPLSEIQELTEDSVVPWFNSAQDERVFSKMRTHHNLSTGESWIGGKSDSSRWDFSGSGKHKAFASTSKAGDGAWSVLMTRHVDQYEIASDPIRRFVNDPGQLAREQPERGLVMERGRLLLSDEHPIITYRFPSRNDDSRTLIATTLPAAGFLYSTGYSHGIVHPKGTPVRRKLALLGYINSVVADWWARRFVDRHVGSRVINGLPLPDWTEIQISEAGSYVEELISRGGIRNLPGGHEVTSQSRLAPMSDRDLRLSLDCLAANGFHLDADDVEVILSDFKDSKDAVPTRYRTDLIRMVGGVSP